MTDPQSTHVPIPPQPIWREIPGYPGYRVSDHGQIVGPTGKVLRPQPRNAYLYVMIRRRKLYVHHAVLIAFVGPKPPGLECRHLDGDGNNNHLSNLCWGTHTENMADRLLHGNCPTGETVADARLTREQARAIREDPRSSRVVGREYGVSHTTVLEIRRGESWKESA